MEETAGRARSGRLLPVVLIVLATIIGTVSVFALWGKRQLLETETFSATSGELIADDEIQAAVADFVTSSLFTNVDVSGELAKRLPPELAPLAGPATGALRNVADDLALKALDEPKVQALWQSAVATTHAQLIRLIQDRGEFVSTTDGTVSVDLRAILAEVAAQIGIDPGVAEKLPDGAASFEVMRSDELETAQRGIDLLRTAAYVLTALTLILFAVAVALAAGRRREILRDVGIGFLVIGAVVLLVRGFAGDAVVDQLSSTPATDAPVRSAFTIGTSLLEDTGQSVLAYGLVILAAAWIAGPAGWAIATRRAVAPYLRQPRIAFGGLAALLALLFWWDPVVSTHRLVPSLILVVLLAAGTEALRRQVIGEFPDAVTARSPAGVARQLAARMESARGSRTMGAAEASPEADRIGLLERLAALRESGLLSDEELAAEKQRLLEA